MRAYGHARQTFIHGNLARAESEANLGYRRFASKDPAWAWKFRALQAEALLWQGKYPDVVALLNSNDFSTASVETTVSILCLRGIAHARRGELSEATADLDGAHRICSSSSNCGQVFQALGVVALGQDDVSGAQQSLEQALALSKIARDPFLEVNALLNLTAVLLKQSRFDEAVDRASEEYDAANQIQAGDLATAALENLGWAYFQLGDSERAREAFLSSEKKAEQSQDFYAQENALTDIGYIEIEARRLHEAEETFQRALSLAEVNNSQEHIYNALRGLARATLYNNKLPEAEQYARKALELAQQPGNHFDQIYPTLIQGQIAAGRGEASQAEGQLRQVEQDSKTPVYLKWEAQHSLALLFEGEKSPEAVEHEYREAISTLGSARESVTHSDFQVSFLANGSSTWDDYIHFLVKSGKNEDALRWADYSRARTLTEGLGLLPKSGTATAPPLDAKRIAARTHSTLLFYWLGARSSYLWAITPREIQIHSLPGAAEIEHLVDRYNKALTGPQDIFGDVNEDGLSLYTTLIAPVQQLLPGNSKVIIVPDGKLNVLNFETLLVPDSKPHYLIEDLTVVNASSLRLLGAARSAKTTHDGGLLMLANAVSPGPEYSALPNAGIEMANVARHFSDARHQIREGKQATPSAFLAGSPETFSYIHFVAHATASTVSPLDSAIILSRSKDDTAAFKLYARDIIKHPLHANLVTISSCYSAGTRSYSGEGLVGLAWAFLFAGAHNVVAALWDANDLSTAQLMDDFYERLSKGESLEAALRHAKLSLLHSQTPFHRPFYWAPFQFYAGS